MIAVSSQEEAAKYVPVKLSPEPTGKWRWIGTKTLLFEPAGHFPMATRYSITVPLGMAASGELQLPAGSGPSDAIREIPVTSVKRQSVGTAAPTTNSLKV